MKNAALWIVPSVTAALALAVYGPFGVERNFGAFLIGLLLVPVLGVTALVLGVWSLRERRPMQKAVARSFFVAALAPALLIPALWCFVDQFRDPARYAVWATFHHRDLDIARRRDGVFKHWNSWGMAGNGNDSYLASDSTDTLSRPWAKAHRLGCEIVAVQRMDRGIYILTTYDCLLDGFDS